MEAVFDLERLAERPLLRAGAHHAGRDAPRVARLYAHVVNLGCARRERFSEIGKSIREWANARLREPAARKNPAGGGIHATFHNVLSHIYE